MGRVPLALGKRRLEILHPCVVPPSTASKLSTFELERGGQALRHRPLLMEHLTLLGVNYSSQRVTVFTFYPAMPLS